VHGADHADVVDALSHMREKFAYFDAALAVLLESKRRLHQPAGLSLMLRRFSRKGLPIKFVQHGLRIEAIHLRKPAIHEKKNDVLRLGLEMGILDHPGSRAFGRLG